MAAGIGGEERLLQSRPRRIAGLRQIRRSAHRPARPAERKISAAIAPSTATATSPASRLAALLMPDAAPERSSGAEFITVVVSGDTTAAMPSAIRMTGANTPIQKFSMFSASPARAGRHRERAADQEAARAVAVGEAARPAATAGR